MPDIENSRTSLVDRVRIQLIADTHRELLRQCAIFLKRNPPGVDTQPLVTSSRNLVENFLHSYQDKTVDEPELLHFHRQLSENIGQLDNAEKKLLPALHRSGSRHRAHKTSVQYNAVLDHMLRARLPLDDMADAIHNCFRGLSVVERAVNEVFNRRNNIEPATPQPRRKGFFRNLFRRAR